MRVQPNKRLRACLLTAALAITALPLVSAADSDRGRDGDDDRRGEDTLLPGNLMVSRTVRSFLHSGKRCVALLGWASSRLRRARRCLAGTAAPWTVHFSAPFLI
jgi:hypothetical protein